MTRHFSSSEQVSKRATDHDYNMPCLSESDRDLRRQRAAEAVRRPASCDPDVSQNSTGSVRTDKLMTACSMNPTFVHMRFFPVDVFPLIESFGTTEATKLEHFNKMDCYKVPLPELHSKDALHLCPPPDKSHLSNSSSGTESTCTGYKLRPATERICNGATLATG